MWCARGEAAIVGLAAHVAGPAPPPRSAIPPRNQIPDPHTYLFCATSSKTSSGSKSRSASAAAATSACAPASAPSPLAPLVLGASSAALPARRCLCRFCSSSAVFLAILSLDLASAADWTRDTGGQALHWAARHTRRARGHHASAAYLFRSRESNLLRCLVIAVPRGDRLCGLVLLDWGGLGDVFLRLATATPSPHACLLCNYHVFNVSKGCRWTSNALRCHEFASVPWRSLPSRTAPSESDQARSRCHPLSCRGCQISRL